MGEPFDMARAWVELTQEAFAVWCRLMITPRCDLERGRNHLAGVLGVPQRTFSRRLQELRRKGYVSLTLRGRGKATHVVLERRALITGPSGFVRV